MKSCLLVIYLLIITTHVNATRLVKNRHTQLQSHEDSYKRHSETLDISRELPFFQLRRALSQNPKANLKSAINYMLEFTGKKTTTPSGIVTSDLLPMPQPTDEENSSLNSKGFADELKVPFLRANSGSDPLPVDVLENLVKAIQRSTHNSIEDIIKDMHTKLDILSKKHGRQGPELTEKPKRTKPPNLLKEMDKVMDEFLRAQPPTPVVTVGSASSSEELGEKLEPKAVMRSGPLLKERETPKEKDVFLEYDLDTDGDLSVPWTARKEYLAKNVTAT